jgi:DNA polymerase/3'-5' exonuclease PolX
MAKLSEALTLARTISLLMSIHTSRLKIAGSIRRSKADVKDIEIVAIPKFETSLAPSGNLFEPEQTVSRNLLWEWAQIQTEILWIKPGVSEIIPWQPKPDGKYWRGIVNLGAGEDIKLDLFLCNPQNWGVISTIRTGPASFSTALVTFIKNRTPFRVQDGHLIKKDSGEIVPCTEEQHFFYNAGITFVPLAAREAVDPYRVLKLI